MKARLIMESIIPYGQRAYCFYSGIPCHRRHVKYNGHLKATIEHLLPATPFRKILGIYQYNNLEKNIVVASSLINSIVGNAPLKVKYEIRDALHSVHLFGRTDNEKLNNAAAIAKSIIRKYFIHVEYRNRNQLPWDFDNNEGESREILKAKWLELLTVEETLLYLSKDYAK